MTEIMPTTNANANLTYNQIKYLKYKERQLAKQKEYYNKHKEERIKYQKEYYNKNKDTVNTYALKYYHNNKTRLNKQSFIRNHLLNERNRLLFEILEVVATEKI